MLLPLLFTLLFLAVSAPLLVMPLRRQAETVVHDDSEPAARPADAYESALLALRDLEFDHQLGVVAEVDYTRLHEQLLAQAAQALEQKAQTADDQLVAHIEAAVLERRRQPRRAAPGRFCSQCGQPLNSGDRFCTGCGTSLH